MSESIQMGRVRLRYDGILDWKELYKVMHDWLSRHKYEVFEKKHVRKPGTYGNEMEYELLAEREETDYRKFIIEVKIHAYHIEDIEVIVNGEKKHKNKVGMMILDIIPTLELDWQNRWKSKFAQKAQKFLHSYVIFNLILDWMDKLYYEAYAMHTEIKKAMNMEFKYSAY